jgi:arginine utilization regulatory protein
MRDVSIDLEHLSADLRVVLDSINEGIHIVDTCGITVFYNKIAASLDNLDPDEVVGRHILSVFPSLSEDTSTLLSVLRTGRPAPVRQQTFRNYKGDTITTMNSTLPIYSGAKLIGAIEVSKDLTLVKGLVERVVDLQAQLITATDTRPGAGSARYTFDDIVAASEPMKDVISRAKRAAQSGSPVLVYGETGTGKELVVQSIHNSSPRGPRPFIAQNCAALPETLLEGILFGTARGAFTGAENRPGLFEVADGGSLFLFLGSQIDYGLQLVNSGYSVFELPPPVIPFFLRYAFPHLLIISVTILHRVPRRSCEASGSHAESQGLFPHVRGCSRFL